MIRNHLAAIVAVGALMLIGGGLPTLADDNVPPDALEKIRDAAPAKAPVRPAQPRRLLVYTDCKGFAHSSIPYATAALKAVGEKTGAFEVVASHDAAVFKPDSLKRFDAVCFNNTTGDLFSDDTLRKSLLDFVKNGKGVVGIHAATDCFYGWPEFGEMMGGYFSGHPWNEEVTIKIDDPGHPLTAMLGNESFAITDEIYQFREPYSRDRLRVLLSLDASKTDMTKKGISRGDQDFAVSWVRNYGLGRVFYCSLGHREEIFWNPPILQHYLAGIQFAIGDLPADATASAQLDPDGWIHLFNGKDLTGWIAPPGAWGVQEGLLTRSRGGGDIWSEQEYVDFILDLDFKLAPQTNSGVFFRTSNIHDCVQTGIEMQVLDSYGREQPGKHDCGAVYDCLAPSKNMVRKPGEWNHATITCRGSKINIVMNGEAIIDMDLDEWTKPHMNPDGTGNKFGTAYKEMARRGHIGFQDHGIPVWYRNVRIKPLGN